MSTDYHSQHHANHRKMLALLIEEMRPWAVSSADYEKALTRLNRSDAHAERIYNGWGRQPIRTFGTCLDCLGDGRERNPQWIDGETPNEPESIDCETCRGTGLVEITDNPLPVEAAPDDLPF